MTAKPKKPAPPAIVDPARVKLHAQKVLSPSIGAAVIAHSYSVHGEVDIAELYEQLADHCQAAHDGNLKRAESMLTAQAHSLDAIFTNLARRASLNLGQHIGAVETYLKLALKAQGQCRATLETLATIKNPPVVFAKQANIAHGPQQVNNDAASFAPASESEKPQTELLEQRHGERLDTGKARAASGSYQTVATVEVVHRPAQRRRKSHGEP